jgi:hypothetical protein
MVGVGVGVVEACIRIAVLGRMVGDDAQRRRGWF